MDLLELGDDELAPHVGDLHLQLVDLHVAQLHGVVDVVHLALGRHPPVKCVSELSMRVFIRGLKVARWQSLIPSFPWIGSGWMEVVGRNPRKGRDQILQRSVAEP